MSRYDQNATSEEGSKKENQYKMVFVLFSSLNLKEINVN